MPLTQPPEVTTEILKDGWMTQDRAYPDQQWLKQYWGDTDQSHRDAIIRCLERLGPVTSVLEIGCNTGPNLRRIHARWPAMDLAGMDIHAGAIQYGQLQAKEEGWRWVGYQGDLRDLFLLGTGFVDVVLSCYSLAYLDLQDVDRVLAAALACARRAVILCEPMPQEGEAEGLTSFGKGVMPEYRIDYPSRVTRLYAPHSAPRMTRLDITPPHGSLRYVLSILKGDP